MSGQGVGGGRIPIPGQGGGVPQSQVIDGGYPHQDWMGVPPLRLGGGTPSRDWMGVNDTEVIYLPIIFVKKIPPSHLTNTENGNQEYILLVKATK